MRKKMVITESQFKILLEDKVKDQEVLQIVKALQTIGCSGEQIQTLVKNTVRELGFEDVKVNFLGHVGEQKDLMYLVYTEGPIFTFKARSQDTDEPCLEVFEVESYRKV